VIDVAFVVAFKVEIERSPKGLSSEQKMDISFGTCIGANWCAFKDSTRSAEVLIRVAERVELVAAA
jgi:hypothetical protein